MLGGRILVVDNDRSVWQHLDSVLAREGYRVVVSPTGEDALERIAEGAPDAILLDPLLPDMTGHQFLRALREDLGRGDIPVVVMTAMRGLTPRQALSMGASDIAEKPLDDEVLLNKLALALFRAHGEYLPSTRPARRSAAAEDLILIVSHDRDGLGYLEELVTGRGYRTVWLVRATDELPRLARVLEPRAIILDLHLPGIGGLTALHRLRVERALDRVPILVLSDDPLALARVCPEIDTLGAVCLLEPFDDRELLELLAKPGRAAVPSVGLG